MPDQSSYASFFRQWESLLASCDANAASLDEFGPLRDEMAGALEEAKSFKSLQENLEGGRQEMTQKLKQSMERGREAARRLQAHVKSRIGSKSERLTQYGMMPIRKRSRKAKPAAEEPLPVPLASPGDAEVPQKPAEP